MVRELDLEAVRKALEHLRDCADGAPEGAYDCAKNIAELVGEAVEAVRAVFREAGYKADGHDECFLLEAVIYRFFKLSNDDNEGLQCGLIVGEAFGEHLNGPARDRVLANCRRDLQFLREIGSIPGTETSRNVALLLGRHHA